MSDWKTLDLGAVIPGASALETVQDVIDILVLTGNIANGILEILKALVTTFPNPVEASIQVILNTIQVLLDNLRETGVFGLFLIPANLDELAAYKGGYPKFKQLFLTSLNDTEDPNRPQIGVQGTAGALFLLVNNGSVNGFMDQVHALLQLFRLPEVKLRYPAPTNVRIVPADEDGLPSDSLLSLFAEGNDLTTLLLSWEEPKFSRSLYYDFFAGNKFYIERSKSREGTLLTRQKTVQTQINPVQKKRSSDGKEQVIQEPVLDRNGEPIYVWELVNAQNPFFESDDPDVSLNFIAGQYSYILRGTGKGIDEGYYYRIRSIPKDVTLVTKTLGNETYRILERDGKEWNDSEPSPAVFGYLPQIDTTFDVPTALLNTYRAAYLLRFDGDTYTAGGLGHLIINHSLASLLDPQIGSQTIEPTFPKYLLDLMTKEDSNVFFEGPLFPDGAILEYNESRRLATLQGAVASSTVLEKDPFAGASELFEAGFELTVAEQMRLWIDQKAFAKIDSLLPLIIQNETLGEMLKFFYLDLEPDLLGLFTGDVGDVLENQEIRTKVLLILNAFDGFVRQGQPPNWQSLKILRDIIPEGSALVDNLFRIMKSLEGAFEGVTGAFESTIEGLQDRLAILNAIVDFLDQILAFYSSLAILDNISMLYIPPDVGGNAYIAREFLRAGNVPDSGPQHFSAGVALVYGGAGPADVTDTTAVLQLIFGV